MEDNKPGFGHPDCYAGELEECGRERSREHYMTEAVLQAIAGSGKTVEVRGLPWQEGTSRPIATARLTGWVLCKRHNTSLTDLDTEALGLVQIMDRIAEGFNDGTDEEFLVDGDRLERWMLKTLCGFVSSENMVNQRGDRVEGWKPSQQWLEIIFRGKPFPDGYGLYLSRRNAGQIEEISRELLRVVPLFAWDHKTVIGMRMWLFEVEYILAMHDPVRYTTARLLDDAIYRPGRLLYQDPGCQKWLTFGWTKPAKGEIFEIRRLPLIGG